LSLRCRDDLVNINGVSFVFFCYFSIDGLPGMDSHIAHRVVQPCQVVDDGPTTRKGGLGAVDGGRGEG